MKKSIPLFVYGTLQPSRSNAHVLESIGGSWVRASVRGRLKYEGWGAELGYPALLLNPDGEK
ncbi:gamma-glutamylcyclotransferase, partial [bacterium]|nr:gamma-glutamylcyclotransferase [bacterium]